MPYATHQLIWSRLFEALLGAVEVVVLGLGMAMAAHAAEQVAALPQQPASSAVVSYISSSYVGSLLNVDQPSTPLSPSTGGFSAAPAGVKPAANRVTVAREEEVIATPAVLLASLAMLVLIVLRRLSS